MSIYKPEYSFVTKLKCVHPSYTAPFDFSKITTTVTAVHSLYSDVYTGTEESNYLGMTTAPREDQLFWFLYRTWDDGSSSYEIKVKHPMFHAEKGNYRNLSVGQQTVSLGYGSKSVDVYVTATPSVSSGWLLFWDDQSPSSKHSGKLGGAPYEINPPDLLKGTSDNIRIQVPNKRFLGVYKRENFGSHWWAYVSCGDPKDTYLYNRTIEVPISMDIQEINIPDPLS